MEVADQWRREWAGTAEYGKVTEGGVTRRIARAMEVLHASGPGARMRVMRAAYHSSAAPGTPAASFMLHSSRRVISSGFNFLESPSTPIRPLEISSTPLESSPEPNIETENYKVTEPDDFEISEPSKWRGSTKGSSIRMPSEESSSTDNASIIDLDSRLARNLHRKYSYDSENSDIQFASLNNSRNSPLLDTPVTLSTLKYKSLLNSSNEWNTRRKSYSFEDTSPLNETVIHNNDTFAMESSTDSGICKSTEIVNDHIHMDDITNTKYVSKDERKAYNKEDSFQNWLSKNRPISQYRGTKFKSYRDHDVVMEDAIENNITVQSSGKVSITLPVTIEIDDETYPKKNQISEESDRKVKRVEFCKTEVHFAAESGKVKIIATDDKPPPSTDFKKRRSAFVPLQDMIEKPITLFGEKNDFSTTNGISTSLNLGGSEFGESDENTAATKSILKNKIPKPKPYLLGENMAFGMSGDTINKDSANDSVLSAVSLVNKQLKSETRYNSELKSLFRRGTDESVIETNVLRTIKTGPTKNDSLKHEKPTVTQIKIDEATKDTIDEVKNKLNGLQVSPAQRKPKTRQLRDSELTYFGVDNDKKYIHKDQNSLTSKLGRNETGIEKFDNIFHSVKLIQQVSNSVCNSETESDEVQQYQNIPLNPNYAPVPTPRLRSKYDDKPNEINELKVLKPIIEKESHDKEVVSSTRRTKQRRQGETFTNRSISAPPKAFRRSPTEKSHHREDQSTRSSQSKSGTIVKKVEKMDSINARNSIETNTPIYVNLSISTENPKTFEDGNNQKLKTNSLNSRQRKQHKIDIVKRNIERTIDSIPSSDLAEISDRDKDPPSEFGADSCPRQKHSINKDTLTRTAYKDTLSKRLDKTDKTRHVSDTRGKTSDELNTSRNARKSRESKVTNEKYSTNEKKDHRTRSVPRSASKTVSKDTSGDINHVIVKRTEHQFKDSLDSNKHDASSNRKGNLSKDKSTKETIKPLLQSNSANKDFGIKLNSNKSNKRREYVINYDDKNGTVSSICKITPNLATPKRKKTSKEVFKDNNNDKIYKNRIVDKIAPLQPEDRQEDRNGLNYANKKWKTKVHVQRSCQVL